MFVCKKRNFLENIKKRTKKREATISDYPPQYFRYFFQISAINHITSLLPKYRQLEF